MAFDAQHFWLVRHPETDYNAAGRYQSVSDRPFSGLGRSQASALRAALEGLAPDLVVSTGQERTDAVAAGVAADAGGVERATEPRLGEIDHGRWEGMTYREVKARWPGEVRARFADARHGRATDGESLDELEARVGRAWEELRAGAARRVVIVAHATPLRVVLCRCLGLDATRHWQWRLPTASASLVGLYPAGAILGPVGRGAPYGNLASEVPGDAC